MLTAKNTKVINKAISEKRTVVEYWPLEILIEFPDQKCNARCPYCYYFQLNEQYNKLISTKNATSYLWGRLERYIQKFNSINISGGEPFANDFIKSLYEKLLRRNKRPKLEIYTNGTLLNAGWMHKLADNFSLVLFSINAMNSDTYERITGLNVKYFYVALNNLNNILKLRGKKQSPYIMVNFVINNINYKEILEYAKYMDSIGIDYIEFNIIREKFNPINRKSYFLVTESDDEINMLEDLKSLIMQAEKLSLKTKIGLERVKYRLMVDKIEKLENPYPFCIYPWGYFSVWLNGGVKFCSWQNEFMGNILEDDLEDIWNGPKAVEFRQKIIDGQFQEVCDWKYCPRMAKLWKIKS